MTTRYTARDHARFERQAHETIHHVRLSDDEIVRIVSGADMRLSVPMGSGWAAGDMLAVREPWAWCSAYWHSVYEESTDAAERVDAASAGTMILRDGDDLMPDLRAQHYGRWESPDTMPLGATQLALHVDRISSRVRVAGGYASIAHVSIVGRARRTHQPLRGEIVSRLSVEVAS